MKSTGVIRRIDELGRIVIPKEIRKNLEIRDGEFLEIFTNEQSIILQKYSKMDTNINLANKVCKILNETYLYKAIITDRDKIIAVEDEKYQEIKNLKLNEFLKNLIDTRYPYFSKDEEKISVGNFNISGYFAIMPIIISTDCIGLVMLVSGSKLPDEIMNVLKYTTKLFEYKIDIA